MRVCIENSTGKIIEMQSNAAEGTLIGNAIGAGYGESEIEEREVTNTEYQSLLSNQPRSAGEIQKELIVAVQSYMDAAAESSGYDDIKTACTYADEPAVPKFQQEGQAFRAWRSLVWAYCYAQLDAVTAGERAVITAEVLIAELPKLTL